MKIGLLQLAPKIGAVQTNLGQILELMALQPKADLFVSPELALLGYPPRDLLSLPAYLEAEALALQQLLDLSLKNSFSILIGHTTKNSGYGKPLFNSSSLVSNGKILATTHKSRNPSYDIFEEERFFEPWQGQHPIPVDFAGQRIAFAICEDSWDAISAFGVQDVRRYTPESNPFFGIKNATLFINQSASPFTLQKPKKREALFSAIATQKACALLYCNQSGGQDGIVFDGRSFAVSADGKIVGRAPAFNEGLMLVEFSGATPVATQFFQATHHAQNFEPRVPGALASDWEDLYQALLSGIRSYVHKTGHQKVILGLSGGIDSTLVATLATHALGAPCVSGFSLPSDITSDLSKNEALLVAKRLGIVIQEIPIAPMVKDFQSALKLQAQGLPFENLQARVRGVVLMGISNATGALLLATGNKSELAMGYSTLYGDMCGGLLPIGDLYKTEVYGLSHYINQREIALGHPAPIPFDSLFRPPTAELAAGQKDADSLPPYEILDTLLFELIENQGQLRFSEDDGNQLLAPYKSDVLKIRNQMARNEFKRYQAPPVLKIHTRSFGAGWAMPLAKGNI